MVLIRESKEGFSEAGGGVGAEASAAMWGKKLKAGLAEDVDARVRVEVRLRLTGREMEVLW